MPAVWFAGHTVKVGKALTVTVTVETPPQSAVLYVIVEVPALTLLTAPVVALIVATAVLLLDQVPPAMEFANVVDAPMHIEVVPVIGAVGATNAAHVPVLVEPEATQFEVNPVRPKLFKVPSLPLLPLASVKVVTPALFEFTFPWLKR